MSQETSIWVRTEPTPDGKAYIVTLNASDDHARTLNPMEAQDYARALLRAAHVAAHDAAVARQLTTLGASLESVAELLADLRKDRPPVEDCATDPLTFTPGVNQKLDPFLTISLDDEPIGQWTFLQAEEHALFILGAVGAADLDAAYYRLLRSAVGLDEGAARAAVGGLADFHEEFRE